MGYKKWKIAELLSACVDYYKVTGRRISFEYTLISGKNDTTENAALLAKLLNYLFLLSIGTTLASMFLGDCRP